MVRFMQVVWLAVMAYLAWVLYDMRKRSIASDKGLQASLQASVDRLRQLGDEAG